MTDTAPQLDQDATRLLAFYQQQFRPFLAEFQPGNVEPLDRQADLLSSALGRPTQVNIGFVGESQVGKSTLINALLERHALPSGGIGPLTARETRVTYADEDRMLVRYHGKQRLNQLQFAITAYVRRIRGQPPLDIPEDELPLEDEALVLELTDHADSDHEAGGAVRSERADYMVAQAQRMLGLDEHAELEMLVDGLRVVLGQTQLLAIPLPDPVQERVRALSEKLGTTEELRASDMGGRDAFDDALELRAAGWLSPLVAELHLGLASPEVEGLSLVDLPGIGVVGDAAAKEAKRFVENEGDAIALVFRNNGVTEAIADLLEQTGVITKMLLGGRHGAAPIHLIVAVTHLDNVTKSKYITQVARLRAGTPLPDKAALFAGLGEEMRDRVVSQVRVALKNSKAFEDLPEELRASREAVVDRLCDQMEVISLAAPDYLALRMGLGGTGITFFDDPEATNVPRFRHSLRQLARAAALRRHRDVSQYYCAFRATMSDHLTAIGHSVEGDGSVPSAEWQRFRHELAKTHRALSREMDGLHGEVAGTIRKGILGRIQTLCAEAETVAQKKLRRLRTQGAGLHYMSLKAALSRGGVWERRSINYPDALTYSVLDVIATRWEPDIIEGVRVEVKRMAERDVQLVSQLVEAALALDAVLAGKEQVEAQKRILQQNARSAVAWTRVQLEELREQVQGKLRTIIEKPIEKACRKAWAAGRHLGTGAKERILDVFEEGGGEALEEARKEAESVLKESYRGVVRKLDEGFFKEHHDPLQAAFDALTQQSRDADVLRREEIRQAVARLVKGLSALPAYEQETELAA